MMGSAASVSYTHLDVYKRQAFDNYLLLDNSKIIRFSDVSQKDYASLIDENDLNRLKTAIRNRDKTAAQSVVCLLYTSRCV